MALVTCPKCGTTCPTTYQFCGRCGKSLHSGNWQPADVLLPPAPSGPAPDDLGYGLPSGQHWQARLIVLRGAVSEGTGFELSEGRNSVGRSGDLAFPSDPLMAAQHIVIVKDGEAVELTTVLGPAGCFRRIREPVRVQSGEVVFAGEQYLLPRLGEDVAAETVSGDDLPAETFGTPLPAPRLHVTQLLAGGLPGRVVSTDKDVLTVGREGCDMSFPQDRFMSGRHLRIEATAAGIQVLDVGSLNGTFVRLAQTPVRLAKGDELLVGGMLFRVDIRQV